MGQVRDEMLLKALGKRIREIRISKNLSQEILANAADIPISQIGRIERGEVNTTVSTLAVLSKALDLMPHQLLNLE